MKILKILIIFLAVCFVFFLSCSNSEDSNVGVVSAGSPEAVSAGLQILKQGGNAVDASIAVAFALAVTEPAQSGLGGQAQFLIYKHGDEPIIINGTSFSPLNLPENISKQDLEKYKATTVPSMVKVLDYLWKNYSAGLEWSDLLNPAIGFAESGFFLTEFRHKVLEYNLEDLKKDPVTSELFLGTNGSLINSTVLWKQPVLAQTLKQLAEKSTEDFYSGDIAKKIVNDMKINNGWITKDDLTNLPNPKNQKPLRGTYRGYEIYTMPPPGGGWVIIQALNILEQFPSDELKLESNIRLKLIAEALQIAHRSRSEEPVEDLINYQ